MFQHKTKFIALLCLFIHITLHAINNTKAVNDFTSNQYLASANISLLIKNVETNETVAEYQSKKVAIPASITKIITTATALQILGDDFRFDTYLETDGHIDQHGTLHGNLYIRGTGDPSLGSQYVGSPNFYYTWIKELRKLGIKRITGSIIGDTSFLDAESINPNWVWEDIGNYYAPGSFGLTYLDNSVNIQLRSGPIGSKATVVKTLPHLDDITFENHLTCTEITYDGAYVHGLPFSNRRYLYGSVPSNRGIFGVRGDIPNPALLLAKHLHKWLCSAGFEIEGTPSYIRGHDNTQRTLLYNHQSPILQDIITEINFDSNNQYAEQLFRFLGSKEKVPAAIHHSTDIIKEFWRSRGIRIDREFLRDGSGLSPQNALSAQLFVDILTYIYHNEIYKEKFISTLPTSGKTGTLRSFLSGTPLEGKVHAKSGTTSRVKSYAGFAEGASGAQYVFTVIVNNATVKSHTVQTLIEQFLTNVCK